MSQYPAWSMDQLVDKETVKTWRIGEQLIYSLLIDAHHPGHKDGIPIFINLMNNISKYIVDEDCITESDAHKIFVIIVQENKPKLLSKVMNNPFIPNSNYDGKIAKQCLKQSIRVGSLDVLNLMIQENVPILSSDMNTFDDIKSIIFNILRSIENHKNIEAGNKFWNYLAKCFDKIYQVNDNNKMEIKWNNDNIDYYENDKDKLMTIRYCKLFMQNPLIQYAIYKKVDASSSGKHYINTLSPILQFICEHFMVFDDDQNLDDLYAQCNEDKVFDCSSLIGFNIKGKDNETIKLFWSQHLCMKLIDDYLGMNQYQLSKHRKIKEEEKEKILDTIKYLISNGVGKHLNDVITIELKGDEYINNKDIQNIMDSIEYGGNIWNIKKLPKDEILSLFSNICNKQIELPHSLCCFILSFIVL